MNEEENDEEVDGDDLNESDDHELNNTTEEE